MSFKYLKPRTLEEAIALLKEYNGKIKIMAGGTDLMVHLRTGRISPEYMMDIGDIEEINGEIHCNQQNGITIGALASIRSLENSPDLQKHAPILAHAAGQLGSVAIRNVGTIGGNLCNAAPSAETAPPLLTLSATLRVAGPDGERQIPMSEFFIGPGSTALEPAELLLEIQIPNPPPKSKGIYFKHAHRGTIDLSIVGVAATIHFGSDMQTCEDVKIGLGAVGPTPVRARQAERILTGKKLDDSTINKAAEAAVYDSSCISDVRASDRYREEMIKVYVQRALTSLRN